MVVISGTPVLRGGVSRYDGAERLGRLRDIGVTEEGAVRIEESMGIAAPPERVWAVMADVERWHEWTASIRSVQLLEPGPLAIGSRARVVQPRIPPVVWQVTELEPGRSFTWVARLPGQRSEGRHTVVPDGAGGSVATLSIQMSGPIGWLVGKLLGGMSRRFVRMEAEGLKRRAEGE